MEDYSNMAERKGIDLSLVSRLHLKRYVNIPQSKINFPCLLNQVIFKVSKSTALKMSLTIISSVTDTASVSILIKYARHDVMFHDTLLQLGCAQINNGCTFLFI